MLGFYPASYSIIMLGYDARCGVTDMVRETTKKAETFYVCEACGFAYKEKVWAEKCEEFCTKHHSCSLEITRHAVQMNQ